MTEPLAFLSLAMALGLDSFRATLGLGALHPKLVPALRLAATFALVEAIAPLVGLVMGGAMAQLGGSWARFAASGVLAAIGLYVLASAARADDGHSTPVLGAGVSILLPLSLSVDNLLAGGGLGLLGVAPLPAAALIGGVSGALALAGLAVGAGLSATLPVRSEVVSGLLLLAAAGAATLGD